MAKNIIENNSGVSKDGTAGGIFKGDRHSAPSGGIGVKVADGGSVLVETDEALIVPEAVNSGKKITFNGKQMTVKEAISSINQKYGGIPIKKKGGILAEGGWVDNTIQLWHGGNLEEYNDIIAQKNGRYEYGAGLYLTSHKETAIKYAKGSRKLYLITIEKGVDISDATLDATKVYAFVNKYVLGGKKKEVKDRIGKWVKEGKIKAYIFNNIMLNEKALSSSNTKNLRSFLIENGIDYDIVDNAFGWGETMLVLYNMDKILEIQKKDKKYESGGKMTDKGSYTKYVRKEDIEYCINSEKEYERMLEENSNEQIKVKPGSVVITRSAILDEETKHEFNGEKLTNKEILSRINQMGGGASFEDGGSIPEQTESLNKALELLKATDVPEIFEAAKEQTPNELIQYIADQAQGLHTEIIEEISKLRERMEKLFGKELVRLSVEAYPISKNYKKGGTMKDIEIEVIEISESKLPDLHKSASYRRLDHKSMASGGSIESESLNSFEKSVLSELSQKGYVDIDRNKKHEIKSISDKGIVYTTHSGNEHCLEVHLTPYGKKVIKSLDIQSFAAGGAMPDCGCQHKKIEYKEGGDIGVDVIGDNFYKIPSNESISKHLEYLNDEDLRNDFSDVNAAKYLLTETLLARNTGASSYSVRTINGKKLTIRISDHEGYQPSVYINYPNQASIPKTDNMIDIILDKKERDYPDEDDFLAVDNKYQRIYITVPEFENEDHAKNFIEKTIDRINEDEEFALTKQELKQKSKGGEIETKNILSFNDAHKYFKGVNHVYKNQFEINKAIEEIVDTITPDNMSVEEKNFISYYAGYGGLEKQGGKGGGLFHEFFTPSDIAMKMWALAYKYGFKGGKVLEPSVGIGEFIKYAPDISLVTGYEINSYSAKICRILYPEATIYEKYFEQIFIKNNTSIRKNLIGVQKYSLVIGNPPYHTFKSRFSDMGEKTYTKVSNYVEYFITRGLDLVESGGLLIYIIGTEVAVGGTPFLSQGKSKVKDDIAEKAVLLDAYRLPNGVFESTDALTDILVFRKK